MTAEQAEAGTGFQSTALESVVPGPARELELLRRVAGRLIPRREASVRPKLRLVVVGNGMVGQRFCERFIELGNARRYELVVLGEEPLPAYDRVHLSDVLSGKPVAELGFRGREWYSQHGIELFLDRKVVAIDRERAVVRAHDGEEHPFDRLVLATGSRAVVPSVPLESGAELLTYRTAADAERLAARIRSSKAAEKAVAVLGGGLLGIEAARSFQKLGCQVTILEASSQLLPRQLDPEAAAELLQTLAGAGLDIRLKSRVKRASRRGDDTALMLEDGEELVFGAVVASVGARAADELMRDAGLKCALRGGVEVNEKLLTGDPRIFAIGECASHAAVPHGLVAPGYVMADVLASTLAGQRARLGPQAAITRLKLDLTEVTVIGDPIAARHDRDLVWRKNGVYRRILLRGRRVVAALSIGFWDELPVLQQLAFRGGKLSSAALARFEKEGFLGARETERGARALPDAAVVCQCANVSCGTLRKAIRDGATDADALSRSTGAASLCGSCRPLLIQLCGKGGEPVTSSRGGVLSAAAFGALLLAALTVIVPRVPLSDSVLRGRFDFLFTETAVKQWTGFLVVGVLAFGLLFSLRKRFVRFRWSSYASLRVVHGVMGVLALLGLFLHTGFRLGSNLNFALAVLFLVSSFTGASAALVLRLEGRVARACAAALKRTHELTFYPLPVLVLFHALKSYYF